MRGGSWAWLLVAVLGYAHLALDASRLSLARPPPLPAQAEVLVAALRDQPLELVHYGRSPLPRSVDTLLAPWHEAGLALSVVDIDVDLEPERASGAAVNAVPAWRLASATEQVALERMDPAQLARALAQLAAPNLPQVAWIADYNGRSTALTDERGYGRWLAQLRAAGMHLRSVALAEPVDAAVDWLLLVDPLLAADANVSFELAHHLERGGRALVVLDARKPERARSWLAALGLTATLHGQMTVGDPPVALGPVLEVAPGAQSSWQAAAWPAATSPPLATLLRKPGEEAPGLVVVGNSEWLANGAAVPELKAALAELISGRRPMPAIRVADQRLPWLGVLLLFVLPASLLSWALVVAHRGARA